MIGFTWNVNGIRAALRKGFLDWFHASQGDIYCLQEIKARTEQLGPEILAPNGYFGTWFPAEKAGYSGVAVLSRERPQAIWRGLGSDWMDREGRVLSIEFEDYILVNAYFPHSRREKARLPEKLAFCQRFHDWCRELEPNRKPLWLCGDFNIAHRDIDLANPKANRDNAGFLPEERAWLDDLLADGFVDVFRRFEPGAGHYSWWSYRKGVRERNIGWRIDYHLLSPALAARTRRAAYLPQVMGSDHCPAIIELDLPDESSAIDFEA